MMRKNSSTSLVGRESCLCWAFSVCLPFSWVEGSLLSVTGGMGAKIMRFFVTLPVPVIFFIGSTDVSGSSCNLFPWM